MKHAEVQPGFWYIYRMINFSHSFDTKKIDRRLGQEIHVKFKGEKKLRKSIFLRIIFSILWVFPAFLAIVFAIVFAEFAPWNSFLAIIWVIIYHFASMYYIIELSDSLKIEVTPLEKHKESGKKKKK